MFNATLTVIPTQKDWVESYQDFRLALRQLYANPKGKNKNDSEFCRANKISRAQFSRVMSAREKPSPKIMGMFEKAFPELYNRHARRWLQNRASHEEDHNRSITVDDLKYLIQVSEGLSEPLTIGLALSLLRLRFNT